MHKRAIVCMLILLAALIAIPILSAAQQEVPFERNVINLTIDVIPGADVGSGSRENWLRDRAEAFEAEHDGVYIIVRSLKSDQAQLLYSQNMRDQMGNIAAYTSGAFGDDTAFLPLENGQTAQLYMSAGYVLLINPVLCSKVGESWQVPSVAAADTGFDCGSILAVQCFSPENTQIYTGKRSDMIALFQRQEVSAIIASNYVAYRFCRAANRGEGFAVEMLPLCTDFTDQGHYVSVIDKSETENEMAKAFCAYLLQETSQAVCRDIGMFSAIPTVECETGTILFSLCENTQTLKIAPPFSWQENCALARQLAEKAYLGDPSAVNDINRLLESCN